MFGESDFKLLAVLGHEFKTPLAIIYGSTQLISQAYRTNHMDTLDLDKHISYILDNVLKLTRISNNISTLANYGNTNPKWTQIDLPEFIERIASEIKKEMDMDLEFEVKVLGESSLLACDCIAMEHVFINLLINAVQYNCRKPQIKVTICDRNDAVEIVFKDNGIGIPKDSFELMFEPFKRGDASGQLNSSGSGLGLFLVKSFIDKHNGTIDVKSVVKKGTTFTITLPRKQEGVIGTLNECGIDLRQFQEILELYLYKYKVQ